MTDQTPAGLDPEALRRLQGQAQAALERGIPNVTLTIGAQELLDWLAVLERAERVEAAAGDVIEEIEDCLAAGEPPRLGPIAGWAAHLRAALPAAPAEEGR